MNAGLIGGILGMVLGAIGGAVGTYFSIKNTNGPQEKSFMIKTAVVSWIVAIIFISLLLLLPKPYSFLLWIPYGIAFPLGMFYVNRKINNIREKEKNMNQKSQ
jgi:phosphotransferase system  glucose/maltose/N-acetylglucosamine-specific IIC component